MYPRMFERADKFISFTPYHFVALTIFLNCNGSLHFDLSLLNQHGDHQFFRIFLKIIQVHLPQIGLGMTIMPATAKYAIGFFICKTMARARKVFKIITMIEFAQTFEHSQKFIAFQPVELIEKT